MRQGTETPAETAERTVMRALTAEVVDSRICAIPARKEEKQNGKR